MGEGFRFKKKKIKPEINKNKNPQNTLLLENWKDVFLLLFRTARLTNFLRN